MKVRRKISARKILQVILTVTVSACCIVAMISAAKIQGDEKLESIAVHIRNDKKYHFIEQNEITDLAINNRHIDIAHTPISKLDIHSMEQVLLANPWVATAEVYIDNSRVLHIYVTQRVPVARIFQKNKVSYYLDTTLSEMPLSKNYVYYTTVVTNVPELKNDSAGWEMKKQIVTLTRAIQADSFWNVQVSQVIVDSDATFELMPVLGDQRILFGNLSDMKEKFSNLFLFYKNVLNRIGWDKYEKLDVRFKGQVVASPSLPYKGPVDKAIGSMNWINAMTDTGQKNGVKDSVEKTKVKPDHSITPINKPSAKQLKKPVKPPQKLIAKIGKQKIANTTTTGKNNYSSNKTINNKNKNKDKNSKQKNLKKAAPKYVYP